MIKLSGRAKPNGLSGLVDPGVWRVCQASEAPAHHPLACLVRDGDEPVPGHGLYLTQCPDAAVPGPALELPADLAHLAAGDVIGIAPTAGG